MKKFGSWAIISHIVRIASLSKEIRLGIKRESFLAGGFSGRFFLKFRALLVVALLLFSGCQKEEKVALTPKPVSVEFKLLDFKFYGEKLPGEKVQTQMAEKITAMLQSFYNSLYFTPGNLSESSLSQISARFFSPSALTEFQEKKTAAKVLISLKPYLRKVISGDGQIKALSIYLNSKSSESIGVAEVEVKGWYLLLDGKKVEINHQAKLVFKGKMEDLKVEEFNFKESLKTYESERKS